MKRAVFYDVPAKDYLEAFENQGSSGDGPDSREPRSAGNSKTGNYQRFDAAGIKKQRKNNYHKPSTGFQEEQPWKNE